jgi:hypothetical protein
LDGEEMTERKHFYNDRVLVIGVDIGKDGHIPSGLSSDGKRFGSFNFSNYPGFIFLKKLHSA